MNGSAPCSLCSKGTYSTETAQISESTCSDCPAHTFSRVGSRQLTNCTCNNGYTGPDGAECGACEVGSFKDVNGTAACTLCAQGTYSTAEAGLSAFTCIKCASNATSSEGSGAITACKCNPGFSGPDGGICSECAAGSYKDWLGNRSCSPCEPLSDSEPASQLCSCNAGSTGADQWSCVLCPAGSYKTTRGSVPCTACPALSNAPAGSTASLQCVCNAGTTGPDGGESCALCQSGKYKPVVGAAACQACPSGLTSVPGSINATDCQSS